MPTQHDPGPVAATAAAAQHSLRSLAHVTRAVRDPRELYAILGSLSAAATALSQSLHQVAAVHDQPRRPGDWAATHSPSQRAATYQVSWELHRAGEIMRQVATAIDHAHEVESTLTYTQHPAPDLTPTPRPVVARDRENGLSL